MPQLTECTVVISLPAHLVTLASGLQAAASLGQLRSLRIHATQLPAAQAAAMPAALPGLADLPALCQLVSLERQAPWKAIRCWLMRAPPAVAEAPCAP